MKSVISSTLLLLLLPLVSSHFTLKSPIPRGFDEDKLGNFPCGGQDTVGDRTPWPIKGGPIQLNMEHDEANVQVLLGLGNDVGNHFNIVLQPTVSERGLGDFCLGDVVRSIHERLYTCEELDAYILTGYTRELGRQGWPERHHPSGDERRSQRRTLQRMTSHPKNSKFSNPSPVRRHHLPNIGPGRAMQQRHRRRRDHVQGRQSQRQRHRCLRRLVDFAQLGIGLSEFGIGLSKFGIGLLGHRHTVRNCCPGRYLVAFSGSNGDGNERLGFPGRRGGCSGFMVVPW